MDDKIQIQGSARKDSGETERIAETRVFSARNNDNPRERRERACPYADKLPADTGTVQNNAVPKGQEFENAARGVPGTEEEVLGAASVVGGVFLQDSRGSHGRNDKGIHRTTRQRGK